LRASTVAKSIIFSEIELLEKVAALFSLVQFDWWNLFTFNNLLEIITENH